MKSGNGFGISDFCFTFVACMVEAVHGMLEIR